MHSLRTGAPCPTISTRSRRPTLSSVKTKADKDPSSKTVTQSRTPVTQPPPPAQKPSETPQQAPEPKPQPPPQPPKRNPRPFISVAFDQAWDTVSDIGRHAGRFLSPLPSKSAADRLVQGADGQLRLQKVQPVVLVLGCGWGAHSCIKVIDTDMFDVVVVSPRNHFVFTPMLPSTAVGTVEFRSLLEPIRTSNEYVTYFEAACDKIDLKKKVAYCTSAIAYEGGHTPTFEVPYDILVVAVGEQPATFNTPGVQEYCYFMKEVTDTVALRRRINECFELASLPGVSDEDKKRLLNFVVVGGGPTGVEFAGTLSDFIRFDLKRKYPELMPHVAVTLLQSGTGILPQFERRLGQKALQNLTRTGVTVRTGARVDKVTEREVVLRGGERIGYGVCVWSTGNATRPLVQSIIEQVPEQVERMATSRKASWKLSVDPFLRVIGARDVLALGDCSIIADDPLPATAQVAAQQGAYLAHMINRGYSVGKGGMDAEPPKRLQVRVEGKLGLPQWTSVVNQIGNLADTLEGDKNVSSSSYDEVAAELELPGSRLDFYERPFEFLSLGIMAYVGNDKALTQFQAGSSGFGFNLYGSLAYLLWRSVYITKQVSARNRVLILLDWLKTRVFGRDTSQF